MCRGGGTTVSHAVCGVWGGCRGGGTTVSHAVCGVRVCGGLCVGEVEQQCHKFVFHPYLSESRVGQPGGGVGWDCTKSRKNVFTSSTLRAPGKRQTQKQVEWFHCSHIVFLEMSGHVGPCPMIITGATTVSTCRIRVCELVYL